MNITGRISLLCLTFVLITGCSVVNQKPDNIDKMDLLNLLITVRDLPNQSWTTQGVSNVVLDRERTDDYLFISFFSDLSKKNTCLRQEVFRYRTTRGSERDYKYASTYFKEDGIPEGWSFISDKANESYFGCDDYGYSCYWVARYERIVIDVRSWRTSDCMNLSELEEVIKKIDRSAID